MLHIPKNTDKIPIIPCPPSCPSILYPQRKEYPFARRPCHHSSFRRQPLQSIHHMRSHVTVQSLDSCRSSYNPSNLFVALLAKQLSLVIVHHRVVAPSSGKAIASRVPPRPVAASASVGDVLVHASCRSPQRRDDERHRSSHCCHGRYGDDGILDPWLIAVKRRAVVSQSDLAEFAIPVAPDIQADGGGQADRDQDGQEDDPARCPVLALKLFLVSLAGVLLRCLV